MLLLRELILKKFTNLIQKKGKYIKAKKLILKSSVYLYNYNIKYIFINVLEYIIKELIVPIKLIYIKKNNKIKILYVNYYKALLSSLLSLIKFIRNLKKSFIKRTKKSYSFSIFISNELKNFIETENNELYTNKNELLDSFLDIILYENYKIYKDKKSYKIKKNNILNIKIKKRDIKFKKNTYKMHKNKLNNKLKKLLNIKNNKTINNE